MFFDALLNGISLRSTVSLIELRKIVSQMDVRNNQHAYACHLTSYSANWVTSRVYVTRLGLCEMSDKGIIDFSHGVN